MATQNCTNCVLLDFNKKIISISRSLTLSDTVVRFLNIRFCLFSKDLLYFLTSYLKYGKSKVILLKQFIWIFGENILSVFEYSELKKVVVRKFPYVRSI